MAKMYATENAQRVIDDAVQMHGGLRRDRAAPGREPVPRHPRAAHLRRCDRGAAADHRQGDAAERDERSPHAVRPRRPLRARPPAAAPSSGRELRFDLPELQYPAQLNCAAELLDRMVDDGRRRPRRCCARTGRALDLRRAAGRRPTASRTCWSRTWALVPGNRVLLRGAEQPDAWPACWFAVVKAGRHRRRHDAAAARQGAGRHHRQGAGHAARCATRAWPTSCRRRRPKRRCLQQHRAASTATTRGLAGRAGDGQPTASSTTSTPRPTTSR